jgi:hypothetical protein
MDGSGKPTFDCRTVEVLIHDVRHARTHSKTQLALIAGLIREDDFTIPVLVDGEKGIIAGMVK